MPDEKGNPLPGEWWETRGGGRAYVAASLPNDLPISSSPHSQLTGWLNEHQRVVAGSWSSKGEWVTTSQSKQDLVKHLPDCTGWDWRPPDWAPLDPVNYGWHVLRIEVDQCRHVNGGDWGSVGFLDGKLLSEKKGNWEFRCLRKDLPQKPPEPVEPIIPEGPRVKAIWTAIHDLQQRMAAHEARDKFFESVM